MNDCDSWIICSYVFYSDNSSVWIHSGPARVSLYGKEANHNLMGRRSDLSASGSLLPGCGCLSCVHSTDLCGSTLSRIYYRET